MKRWGGDYVFVLYTTYDELNSIKRTLSIYEHSQRGRVITVVGKRNGVSGYTFPINRLRNTGIAKVRTTHYAVTDMDSWPSSKVFHVVSES